jgi:hypothetical protein
MKGVFSHQASLQTYLDPNASTVPSPTAVISHFVLYLFIIIVRDPFWENPHTPIKAYQMSEKLILQV